jgi:hypothetical protein
MQHFWLKINQLLVMALTTKNWNKNKLNWEDSWTQHQLWRLRSKLCNHKIWLMTNCPECRPEGLVFNLTNNRLEVVYAIKAPSFLKKYLAINYKYRSSQYWRRSMIKYIKLKSQSLYLNSSQRIDNLLVTHLRNLTNCHCTNHLEPEIKLFSRMKPKTHNYHKT